MTRKSVEIAGELEQAILRGEFAPGELLNEIELSERFGVSRTPVREALLNLSAAGLVELESGRGAVVVGITLDTVFEAYEVLANSLGFASALAAERMTPRQRAELQGIVEEMAITTGQKVRDRYIELDEALHEKILKGCGNALLGYQIRRCKARIAAVRQSSMRSHKSVEHIVPEIARVVDAILARDAEAARTATCATSAVRGDGAQRLMAEWRNLNPKVA
jgi:DNA-binding GntR family transcriptional regulator